MHKLKNKHTGEVITTPYMAEAEEYLKSGDYEMEKPVYTKEMHDRGELPVAGMEVLVCFKGGNTFKGKIKYISSYGFVFEKENGKDNFNGSLDIVEFKLLPTIKDELAELLDEAQHVNKAEIVDKMLKLYNITPKDS